MERGARSAPIWLFCAALAGAGAAFAIAQTHLLQIDAWWADELFTLWATAPQLSLAEAARRIGPDPTPPLYYALLFLLRHGIDLPIQVERLEILALNCGLIAAAALAVLASARRSRLLRPALLAVTTFLISGCTLVFAPEARAYCLAVCVVFVAAWAVAAAITEPACAWSWRRLSLLGLLAAFSHSFAALACGSLAAGAITTGLMERRPGLTRQGFILGLSAVAFCLVRMLLSSDAHASLTLVWILFTPETAWRALNGVLRSEIGSLAGFAALVLAATCAFAARQTRGLTLCFLVAITLSLALPALASFVLPMFVDRYLMVGGPLLLVAAVFWTQAGPASGRTRLTASFAAAFLMLSSISGIVDAYQRTLDKPGWHGAEIVRSAAAGCPAHLIHVIAHLDAAGHLANAAGLENFGLVVPTLPDRFVDATDPQTPWQPAVTGPCPVLGWAEHVFDLVTPGYVAHASDQDLLAALKLAGSPGQYEIVRHATGYVVLRRDN